MPDPDKLTYDDAMRLAWKNAQEAGTVDDTTDPELTANASVHAQLAIAYAVMASNLSYTGRSLRRNP